MYVNYGFNVHDSLKDRTVEELKMLSNSDRLPFAVCLLNLEHDLNIGNCIRTAHIMGAERVFILGNSKVDTRACVGSQNYTEVVKRKVAENETLLDAFDELMYKYQYTPMFIEKIPGTEPLSYMSNCFVTSMKFCLVFGNECSGIPAELINPGDMVFHIEQRGVIRSLNVASACAIACYEFSKLFLEW